MIATLHQLRAHLRRGGVVALTRGDKDKPEAWFDPATGEEIDAGVIASAKQRRMLKPRGDGLFGDSQIFERARR